MTFQFLNCTYDIVSRNITIPINSTYNSSVVYNVSVLNTSMTDCIANRFTWAVGNDLLTSLLFVGFFGAFVMMQDTRLDFKLAIMVPIIILAFYGSNILFPIIILALAWILLKGIEKLVNR